MNQKKNHRGWSWESNWGMIELRLVEETVRHELEVGRWNSEVWAWGLAVTGVSEWEWVTGEEGRLRPKKNIWEESEG